jgi:hypothetical protein
MSRTTDTPDRILPAAGRLSTRAAGQRRSPRSWARSPWPGRGITAQRAGPGSLPAPAAGPAAGRRAVARPGRDGRPGRRRSVVRPRCRPAGRPGRRHRQRPDHRAVRRVRWRGRAGGRRGRGGGDHRPPGRAAAPPARVMLYVEVDGTGVPMRASETAGPARARTARPAPARSSSPGCSPSPASIRTAGR